MMTLPEELKKLAQMQPWEWLMKQIIWMQLGDIKGKKILDFGSGTGITADFLAQENSVTAIEPSSEQLSKRKAHHKYLQLIGSTNRLQELAAESFDIIICHNVLEYTTDRTEILKEFSRLLKTEGQISIVKHNRNGRIVQMIVLLNDFEHARHLLDGHDGQSTDYGSIRYYDHKDIEISCPSLRITNIKGLRTFWHLQQHQDLHTDSDWQEKMIQMEMQVADIAHYRDIAFLHHIILKKVGSAHGC